jgi:hypothetical protein
MRCQPNFQKLQNCNLNKYATKYAWEYVTNDTIKKDEEKFTNEVKRLFGHDLNDILFDCWFYIQQCDSRDLFGVLTIPMEIVSHLIRYLRAMELVLT